MYWNYLEGWIHAPTMSKIVPLQLNLALTKRMECTFCSLVRGWWKKEKTRSLRQLAHKQNFTQVNHCYSCKIVQGFCIISQRLCELSFWHRKTKGRLTHPPLAISRGRPSLSLSSIIHLQPWGLAGHSIAEGAVIISRACHTLAALAEAAGEKNYNPCSTHPPYLSLRLSADAKP